MAVNRVDKRFSKQDESLLSQVAYIYNSKTPEILSYSALIWECNARYANVRETIGVVYPFIPWRRYVQ